MSPETRTANFCGLHERNDEAAFMWRTEQYKLILQFNKEENAKLYDRSDIIGGEFYNLNSDKQEWNNLYNSKEVEEKQNIMTVELIGHLKKLKQIKTSLTK